MKKETILSILIEIRDLLKKSPNEINGNAKVESQEYIIIKDDGRKTSEIIEECRSLFNVYSYYSNEILDEYFQPVISERKFKYLQEADSDNANKSANDLNQKDQITLRERLLMEIIYFKKIGSHLDMNNITLCAGSRAVGGLVPYVVWRSFYRGMYVGWYGPGAHDAALRARSAVKN